MRRQVSREIRRGEKTQRQKHTGKWPGDPGGRHQSDALVSQVITRVGCGAALMDEGSGSTGYEKGGEWGWLWRQ